MIVRILRSFSTILFAATFIAIAVAPGTAASTGSLLGQPQWQVGLGQQKRILSFHHTVSCFMEPCPAAIMADAEGHLYGIHRFYFATKYSTAKSEILSRMIRCAVQFRGKFRRGTTIRGMQLFDLVVDEVHEKLDSTCR